MLLQAFANRPKPSSQGREPSTKAWSVLRSVIRGHLRLALGENLQDQTLIPQLFPLRGYGSTEASHHPWVFALGLGPKGSSPSGSFMLDLLASDVLRSNWICLRNVFTTDCAGCDH
jgi:hypothetical protein